MSKGAQILDALTSPRLGLPRILVDATDGPRRERVIDRICDALCDHGSRVVNPAGPKTMACCPVPGHGQGRGDINPSLEIKPRNDGKGTRIICYANCDYRDVLDAIGLRSGDLAQAHRTPPATSGADSQHPGMGPLAPPRPSGAGRAAAARPSRRP